MLLNNFIIEDGIKFPQLGEVISITEHYVKSFWKCQLITMNQKISYFQLECCEYCCTTSKLRKEINDYLNLIWPDHPAFTEKPAHNLDLHPICVLGWLDKILVAYAAILNKTINIAGQAYQVSGLSCVSSHPQYRGQGYAGQVVAQATRWIEENHADLGLFTCDPELASFYRRYGWRVADNIELIGNDKPNAISSLREGKLVQIKILSERAHISAQNFRATTINLDLPVGEFW